MGANVILFVTIIILSMITCYCNVKTLHHIYCRRVLFCHLAFLIVLFFIASFIVFFYGIAISHPVYNFMYAWNEDFINCTSPIFYTAFTYLTIQYSMIGLIILLFIIGFVLYLLAFTLCPNTLDDSNA